MINNTVSLLSYKDTTWLCARHTLLLCSEVYGGFIGFSLFFWLEPKETKVQGCIFFAKIVRLVAKGAQTRFAQTVAPSSRYIPHNFFTQKK